MPLCDGAASEEEPPGSVAVVGLGQRVGTSKSLLNLETGDGVESDIRLVVLVSHRQVRLHTQRAYHARMPPAGAEQGTMPADDGPNKTQRDRRGEHSVSAGQRSGNSLPPVRGASAPRHRGAYNVLDPLSAIRGSCSSTTSPRGD